MQGSQVAELAGVCVLVGDSSELKLLIAKLSNCVQISKSAIFETSTRSIDNKSVFWPYFKFLVIMNDIHVVSLQANDILKVATFFIHINITESFLTEAFASY